jgi:hypothetical protein
MKVLGAPTVIRNEYIPLSGTPRSESRTGAQRLYLGPNHLLCLRLAGHRELARRFYYTDITALRCVPTWKGYFIDGVFIAVAVLLWVAFLTSPGAELGVMVLAVTATIIAAVDLVVNYLRGPTCYTWLHTANHSEPLSSLNRYHTARHALGELQERIVEAQGTLDVTHPGEKLPPFVPVTSPGAPAATTDATAGVVLPHASGLMRVAFYLALVTSATLTVELLYNPDWLSAFSTWEEFVLLALCAAAYTKSEGTDCPTRARRLTFYILFLYVLLLPLVLVAFALLAAFGVDVYFGDTLFHIAQGNLSGLLLFLGVQGSEIALLGLWAWQGLSALSGKQSWPS